MLHPADKSLHIACSVKIMFNHINPKNGQKAPLIADDVFAIIMEVRDENLMLLSLHQDSCVSELTPDQAYSLFDRVLSVSTESFGTCAALSTFGQRDHL